MSKKIFLAVFCAQVLTACASMQRIPVSAEESTVARVKETTLSKKEAFRLVSAMLAKSLGDSNSAIKLKDEDAGQIVAQMSVPCNDLWKDPLGMISSDAQYTVEVNFKDKKVKTTVTADKDIFKSDTISIRNFHKGNIEIAKKCADKIFDIVDSALSKKSGDNW